MIKSRYNNKQIKSKYYRGIKIEGSEPTKFLTDEKFKNREQGIVYVPWVTKPHTDESLKEYNKFMDKYKKEHKVCPKCGATGHSTTLWGFVVNWDNKEDYKNKNNCVCTECGNVHIKHDRINIEKFKILNIERIDEYEDWED